MSMSRDLWCRALVLFLVCSIALMVPATIVAQTSKGVELYKQSKFPEAEKVLREVLKSNPSDMLAQYYLGLSVLMQEKFGEALDLFAKVKGSRDKADPRTRPSVPNEYQLQLAMARARLGLGQYGEAWKNLESARREDPNAADVYVYRGEYFMLQKKNDEAIRELEKAIKMDAKNAYAYYYLGLTYHQAKQPAKAVDALKMFLQLDPQAPEASKAQKLIEQLC